jgi:hypothetical protein
MKTAHATAHGIVALPGIGGHGRTTQREVLGLAERAVGAAVLLGGEMLILWILMSAMYLSSWPVQ